MDFNLFFRRSCLDQLYVWIGGWLVCSKKQQTKKETKTMQVAVVGPRSQAVRRQNPKQEEKDMAVDQIRRPLQCWAGGGHTSPCSLKS